MSRRVRSSNTYCANQQIRNSSTAREAMIRYVLGYRQFRVLIADTDRPRTIRDSLGKRPARLPDTLWHILRAYCPIRTVEEEQQELFKDAKPCAVPDTTFASAVDRSLRACFALLKFTDYIQVVYV